jgi:FkbM family methyltransferase
LKNFSSLKRFLKTKLPAPFFARKYYSQNAEDVYLFSLLRNDRNKFYVDVGCNHPFRDNNTYFFSQRGWCGINIDALPENIKMFEEKRGVDINLNVGVHQEHANMHYWEFDESAVNTLDPESAERCIKRGAQLKRKHKIKVEPLSKIFAEYLPKDQDISFMSVDVEGVDLPVLRSNDWDQYRPKCVLVEINDQLIQDYAKNDIINFMQSQGYLPFGKTINNWIFVDEKKFIKRIHSDSWWCDD